jgi:uncharacterized protein
MILYLGTSSLIKLYIDERCSDMVREWVKEAEIVATCRVAYTEMISALELRLKQNNLSKSQYDHILRRFSEDWLNFAIVDFDERDAGSMVRKYALNRFAAIHLSAARLIRNGHQDISLSFSSVDENLCRAATAEGMRTLAFE